MLHICCFIILHYKSYWIGKLAILETFPELTEQDVVNLKNAEKSEKCNKNDFAKKSATLLLTSGYIY